MNIFKASGCSTAFLLKHFKLDAKELKVKYHPIKYTPKSVVAALCLALSLTPAQASLNIAETPLFITPSVDPNIMFILDDSGSMQWEIMPDQNMYYTIYVFPNPANLYGGAIYSNQIPDFNDSNIHNVFSRSPQNNTVFYNPTISYVPWRDSNSASLGDITPSAAPYNPVNTGLGTLNLTAQQTQSAIWFNNTANQNLSSAWLTCGNPCNQTYWPMTFYMYKGTGAVTVPANYIKYQIRGSSGFSEDLNGGSEASVSNFVWANGVTRTVAEEQQNFANWFSYYRSRVLSARAGIGRAFAEQGEAMRVGFGALNKVSTSIDGVNTRTVINGVRPFSGSDRTNFFNQLYNHAIPTSGTPLRRALDDAGQYFSRTDNTGPWSETPGTSSSTSHLACRQSFSILMTDGYWNSNQATTTAARANTDGAIGPTNTGPNSQSFSYSAASPFADTWSNTLADVSMYYWKNDLRTSLLNRVPITTADPAFWQHMVTFGIGLGVSGTVTPPTATDWGNIAAWTPSTAWPQPSGSGTTANIDDLLHAGVNGHGGFFSAANPDVFATQLSAVLSNIVGRTEGSAAGVATNSTRLGTDTMIFQAKFDSRDWTGQLQAFPINSDGSIGSAVWDAGVNVTTQGISNRSIFSYNSSTNSGISFLHANLSAMQQTYLTVNEVNYLRGDQSNELSVGGTLRTRSGTNALMGDVVNSNPWLLGNTNYGYHLLAGTEGTDYSTFRNSAEYNARTELVVVGANDGMLHAFNANVTGSGQGDEVFAYVPHTLMLNNKLRGLTQPAYAHEYFVDSSPVAGDAYFDADGDGDKDWRSVLVGALGAGGKGIFALDMTFLNPSDDAYATAEPSFLAQRVLWEKNSNDSGFSDLGFNLGEATIVRMQNGEFVAVFGNGYNSVNHEAVLYIVNIKTGALIKSIATGVGDSANPNGLSTPIAVDVDSDRIVDAIYAGDLHGNLWKFDVSQSNTNQWDVAFQQGSTPKPLFIAVDSSSVPQPITAKPQVGVHPEGGVMVYFGTGKFFEVGDNTVSNPQIQTFYGIWDDGARVSSRASLVEQTIDVESIVGNFDIRVTSENTVDYASKKGWYMDFDYPPAPSAIGERIVSHALLRGGRIIFATMFPEPDPCDYGGGSWLMEIDALTGQRLKVTPFDITGDGKVDSSDMVNLIDTNNDGQIDSSDDLISVSGKKSTVGIIKSPGVISAGGLEYKYTSGSTGALEVTTESADGGAGRQSWIQLR
jgi:type IV pilus assembly protein PilY1